MASTRRAPSPQERQDYLISLCRTVPYHIVEDVLADPTEQAIATRHFDGCVMFADLVGFTPMCEHMAAAGTEGLSHLSSVLDGLFEQLLERGIFPYNGYVVHFGGDSITTVFHGEDHARRCIASAITLQRLMFEDSGRLLKSNERDLILRIGIASGPVSLPVIGDLARRSVVCAGATAHRALSLQQTAQPDEIIVDTATVERLGDRVSSARRQDDSWLIGDLHTWPTRVPVYDLQERTRDRIEDKIALLEPFVPQPLAMRLRTTQHGWRIEGELRDLAIVFAEIWGLDEADGSPELAKRMAQSVPRTVHKYGGIVSKADLALRGHRLMGLFGLASPSENDAERAILAALELTTRIKSFTLDRSTNVGMRVGVHFGRVYFGAIGSTHKYDITAVGDAVNVAARTAASGEVFDVLVTQDALASVKEQFQVSERAPLRVKGRTEPLSLCAVHGVADGRARYVQRRSRRRFLAGRDREGLILDQAVDEALAGTTRVVGLCGEAGTGKSALLANVIDRWLEHGGVGVLGRCQYATRTLPLAPIVTMFYNYLGFGSGDSDSYRRTRIRELLSKFQIQHGANELVALLQPVHLPDGTTETQLDFADNLSRERVIDAIAHFVERRLDDGPVLYVLEDMHYADSLTRQLAMRLASGSKQRKFFGILTYRPDPLIRDFRRAVEDEYQLLKLDEQQIERLVLHETGADRLDPHLCVFLQQRTKGNPAHIVEILRFLEDRQLIKNRSGVVLPSSADLSILDEAVPPTIAHVALARMDTMGEVERRLLRTASAIGRRFRRSLLERVTAIDLEPDLLESAVESLESQQVLAAESDEQPGYAFRDDIVRAVAYDTIPEDERRQVHRRIADALEKSPENDPRRSATVLGQHRERAGQLEEAARWYVRAIELTAALSVDNETLELVERWQRLVERLPVEQQPDPHVAARIALHALIATARGASAAATVAIGRAMLIKHRETLDEASWLHVDYWLGDALIALGRPEKARVRLERVVDNSKDRGLQSDAARLIASTYAASHERQHMERWLQCASVSAQDDVYRTIDNELVRANFLLYVGEIESARAIFAGMQSLARQHKFRRHEAVSTSDLARCDLAICAFPEAEQGFRAAIVLARSLSAWALEAFDLLHLGQAMLWAGNPNDALVPLETSLSMVRELGNSSLEAEALVHLGLAIAMTRDPVEGQRLCEQGFRMAVRAGLREVEIAADLHLLRIALLRKDRESAQVGLERCHVHEQHLAPPLYRQAFTGLRKLSKALLV